MFRDHYNIPLIHADEADLFLGALEGVSDPEQKRKTIGRLFIDVFQKHAHEVGGAEFLAQGTLYPDVIESVSFSGGPSVTIKSHHNVGGLPETDGPEAGRAAARALQGRGPRAGPRARPARRASSAATPSPAPASPSAAPARSRREKLAILRKADAVYIDQIRQPRPLRRDLAGLRRRSCPSAPSA